MDELATMTTWYDALAWCKRTGVPHVLCTLVSSAGSTPREPGAGMLVTHDQIIDTLGGGQFEHQLIALARKQLVTGDAHMQLERFPLGVRSGQCCGGHVSVLVTTDPGATSRLALFGAGHVATALERLLAPLDWRIDWYDSRPLPGHVGSSPRTRCHFEHDTLATAECLQPGTHALVMTHDHHEDEALIQRLATHGTLASVGMIGSATKWARFRHRLLAGGTTEQQLNQVRCPIGLPGIGGKRPHEIAIAVAAELLTLAPVASPSVLRGLDGPALTHIEQITEPS
ncbi:xanthine dehydrogenase accessory protein XdhC [Larsenimonas rhizosphaerae]|uniref:xanthine dehydrogenase accessory protein XdhC n=1 Tax=Larsenimonas rhizosphaerae TaxID=2944682 RepID=UPI002033FB5E|nr:xanthine dehydrogenase accessory protein XdhC [Larsenimonas rhizosphaerae]MCM2130761.1 xanthine dehydrogenase accessory protein XdhC [Larsenimonas rhizosphaerae]